MNSQTVLDNKDTSENKKEKRTPLPWSVLFAGFVLLIGISAVVFSVYLNLPPHPPVKDFGLPSEGTRAMSAVFTALRARYSPEELVIMCSDGTESDLIDWYMNTHRAEHEPGKNGERYEIVTTVPEQELSSDTRDMIIIVPQGEESENALYVGSYSSGRHAVSMYLSPYREPLPEPVETESDLLPLASYCTALVSQDFTLPAESQSDTQRITFRHKEYPYEAASVSYAVVHGAVSDTMTREELSETLSARAKAVYGERANLEITAFARKVINGFPTYCIYTRISGLHEQTILQTSLLVLSKEKTFILSCSRADDDTCEEEQEVFIASARVQKK